MDGAEVARLVRALAKIINRRQLSVLFGALLIMLFQRVSRAFQRDPATCREQGALCTLLARCCDGLTCATSAINANYGICVPAEGRMVLTGTTPISPFSETAVDEVPAPRQRDATAPATDRRAKREARTAKIRARRDAKRSKRRTRLDTRPGTRQRREGELDPRPQLLRPQLKLELQFQQVDGDSERAGDQLVPIEVVRATNRDDVNIVLTRIETIQGAVDGADLTTSEFTLVPGQSYSFVSGLRTEDAADAATDVYRWLGKVICDNSVAGQGYRMKAAFSRDAENYEFIVGCDGPLIVDVVDTPSEKSRRKPKRNDHRHNKKKR